MTRALTNVIIGRIGGPAVLGTVATGIATAQLLSLLWPTSSGAAATKFVAAAIGQGDISRQHGVQRHLGRRTLQATLVVAGAAFLVYFSVLHHSVIEAVAVGALAAGYSGYAFTRGFLFGSGQIPKSFVADVVCAVIGMAGVSLCLLAGMRGLGVLLPLAGTNIAYALLHWPRSGKASALPSDLRRELDVFVGFGVVGTLASAGFLQGSMIFAAVGFAADETGAYSAALTLATPASIVAGAFGMVLFPSMAQAWGRGDEVAFKQITDRSMKTLTFLMVGIFGALMLMSQAIVDLVWGADFTLARTLLPVLLGAILANAIGITCTQALTARTQKGMATSTLIGLTGLILGLCVWAGFFHLGVMMIAVGYLAGASLIAIIPIALIWRRDGHEWSSLILKVSVGLVVLASLVWAEHSLDMEIAEQMGTAVFFLALWCVMRWREACWFWGLVRRSVSQAR